MKLSTLLADEYFRKNFWEFLLIVQDVLGVSKEKIYTQDIEVSLSEYQQILGKYRDFYEKKIPIEYVLWYAYFMGEKFFVNSDVLIPRPETEYLVNYALKVVKNYDVIFDIWTGSGIIGIMIAKKSKKPVVLSDISEKALKIAQKNAKTLCSSCDIKFVLSNLGQHVGSYSGKKLILANLPYVDESYSLDEYTQKEPYTALFASKKGLWLYIELLNQIGDLEFLFELTSAQAKWFKENYKINLEILPTCHSNIKILHGNFK